MKDFPRNCTTCEFSENCLRYYGAKDCQYEKEITKAILESEEIEKINRLIFG